MAMFLVMEIKVFDGEGEGVCLEGLGFWCWHLMVGEMRVVVVVMAAAEGGNLERGRPEGV